jgi:hypothetical protein
MLSQTNINQRKYFKKAIELGLSMDMDLAVQINLAGVDVTKKKTGSD